MNPVHQYIQSTPIGGYQAQGSPAISAPGALYSVAKTSKRRKNPPELLAPAAPDCACGIRLIKIKGRKERLQTVHRTGAGPQFLPSLLAAKTRGPPNRPRRVRRHAVRRRWRFCGFSSSAPLDLGFWT